MRRRLLPATAALLLSTVCVVPSDAQQVSFGRTTSIDMPGRPGR